jgi:hypothetical protein
MTILGPASRVAFVRPPHGVLRPDAAYLDVLAARIARELHPAHAAAVAGPLLASSDLTKDPPTNQGPFSTCSWHALVKGIEIVSGFRGSMHVGYSATGALEGTTADNGRRLVDCLTIARTIGVAPFEGPTADGRNSDIDASNVSTVMTGAESMIASERRFDFGGNSIDPSATTLARLVIGSLACGAPAYIAVQIGQAFEDLGNGVVAQPDPRNDPAGGGHALLIVGHRTNADGSIDWLVQNSWSEAWSGGGECWASLAWLQSAWEIHPLILGSTQPPTLLQRIEAAL